MEQIVSKKLVNLKKHIEKVINMLGDDENELLDHLKEMRVVLGENIIDKNAPSL